MSGSHDDATEVCRLRRLFSTGELVHPFLAAEYFQDSEKEWDGRHLVANFTDLAAALAMCCGVPLTPDVLASEEDVSATTTLTSQSAEETRRRLAQEIGGGSGGTFRRHIILVLCDGMGNDVMERHLRCGISGEEFESFLLRRNNPNRLRAVFPSTTPAALTTLATAVWPGRHGMPGWDLRDQKGCDYPGDPAENSGGGPTVQIRVLAEKFSDVRSGKPAAELGFGSWEDVFVVNPWAKMIGSTVISAGDWKSKSEEHISDDLGQTRVADNSMAFHQLRRMIYINAYNGDDFPSWYQGQKVSNWFDSTGTSCRKKENLGRNSERPVNVETSMNSGTDFSSWQIGGSSERKTTNSSAWFETAVIGETAYQTLGEPEGSHDAIRFFRDGVNSALAAITAADAQGIPTFTYLYTAHPDKHMHALGVNHPEVRKVVRGIDMEIKRLWQELGKRGDTTREKDESSNDTGSIDQDQKRVDASVIVTADHGHVTVLPEEMVALPSNIIDCLVYANLGVHGKGRHAYLHCRAGLQSTLRHRWRVAGNSLADRFLLLTIDEAVDNGLFGPLPPVFKVRPRLGDFVAISTGNHTLVSPKEAMKYKQACPSESQGAHGSLLSEEMEIPYVLCVPDVEG